MSLMIDADLNEEEARNKTITVDSQDTKRPPLH
jgi:hypothetical protein